MATSTATGVEWHARRSERLQLESAINMSQEQRWATRGTAVTRRHLRRPKQPTKGKLLKLPGEILNLIYRYAVVSDDKITVKSDGPGEPALLRVCKSIRKATRSLYYTENRFCLQVHHYNGVEFEPFGRQYLDFAHLIQPRHAFDPTNGHSRAIKPRTPVNLIFEFEGDPNWGNLVRWIQAKHYRGNVPVPNMNPAISPTDHVLNGAFKLAKTLERYHWGLLEHSLDAFHEGLKGSWSPWGRDAEIEIDKADDDDDDDNYDYYV